MITRDQIAGVLTGEFPAFFPDGEHLDLPYLVLSDFARFLSHLHQSGEDQGLTKAAALVERLHREGDPYAREAVTIGLFEAIQNTWEHADADPAQFAERFLPESRRWWDSLNKFWRQEIPYVGADL